MNRIVVGGVVYRQALQAPKQDVFDQFSPKLKRWQKIATKINQYLQKFYQTEPQEVTTALEGILKSADKVPYAGTPALKKWADGLSEVGTRLVDLERTTVEKLDRIDQRIREWKKWVGVFEKEYAQTKNPSFDKLAQAVKSLLEDALGVAQ